MAMDARVVADTGDEVDHEFCCYHAIAGPVRPDAVTNLRVDAHDKDPLLVVKWEWSENSFDLASPGACFERSLTYEGGLAWAGPVTRTAKAAPKPPPVPPRPAIAPRPVSAKGAPVRYLTDEQKAALNAKYGQLQKPTAKEVEAIAQSGCKELAIPDTAAQGATLRVWDLSIEDKWSNNYGNDNVKIIATHQPSGSCVQWDGGSTAENQSIRELRSSEENGFVRVTWVYAVSENGSGSANRMGGVLQLAGGQLQWETEPSFLR